MSYWEMYVLVKLDAIHSLMLLLTIAAGTSTGFSLLCMVVNIDEKTWEGAVKRLVTRWTRISIAGFVVFLLLRIAIPSTKEAAAIYLVPKIVNNAQVQKLPDNVVRLLNTKLEEWIDDSLEIKKDEK